MPIYKTDCDVYQETIDSLFASAKKIGRNRKLLILDPPCHPNSPVKVVAVKGQTHLAVLCAKCRKFFGRIHLASIKHGHWFSA